MFLSSSIVLALICIIVLYFIWTLKKMKKRTKAILTLLVMIIFGSAVGYVVADVFQIKSDVFRAVADFLNFFGI